MKILSKFTLIILMLFTSLSFGVIPKKEEEKKNELYCYQVVSLFLFANRQHIEPKVLKESIILDAVNTALRSLDQNNVILTKSEKKELLSYYKKNSSTLFYELFGEMNCSIFDELISKLEMGEKRFISILQSEDSEDSVESEDSVKNKSSKLALKENLELKDLKKHLLSFKSGKPKNAFSGLSARANKIDTSILILNSLLGNLDTYSAYIENKVVDSFENSNKAKLIGIGVMYKIDDNGVLIEEVLKGGAIDDFNKESSFKVKAGDRIVEFQGDLIGVHNSEKFTNGVPNKVNEEISLVVMRGNKKHKVKIKTKEVLNTPLRVSSEIINHENKKILKVKIPSFYLNEEENYGTTSDFLSQYSSLKEKVDLIVIDLRDNGGGFVQEAVGLSSLFLGKRTIFHERGSSRGSEVKGVTDSVIKEPVVILANKGSASASEIFMGAMQDYSKALIIGDSQSHGKGSVQFVYNEFRSLGIGLIKVTFAKYYTPSGIGTQEIGIKSDIILFDDKDYKLEKDYPNHLKNDKITSSQKKNKKHDSVIKKVQKEFGKKIIDKNNEDEILNKVYEISSKYQDLLKKERIFSEKEEIKERVLSIIKERTK